ncbi:cob(I)yrinic acid a,c-diamide adenosyltransferase [Gluconobacter morbifer]|nr:cob(I)yrinic acid a,c-diamide adenosyltransferase [Gluconobacter morbifer]
MTIRIDRVVTRGGDGGQTSLGDGTRVSKCCPRIEAMGTVDELNAHLGLLHHYIVHDPKMAELGGDISRLQSCLFDLGADLCIPDPERPPSLTEHALIWLEGRIEALRDQQPALQSFILPGGSLVASHAHLVRTVARRAERRVSAVDPMPALPLRFLNRLSDYFFVLGRHANDRGNADICWRPGQWR